MKIWKKAGSLSLALLMTGAFLTPQAAMADTGKYADGRSVVIARDEKQMAARISRRWDSGKYYTRAEIDPAEGTVLVDGEETDLGEFLELSPAEEKSLTASSGEENREQILDYLEEQQVYAAEDGGQTVTVSSPYQTRRIILDYAGDIEDTFGAEMVTFYEPFGQYVLEYGSQEAAKAAAEALGAAYGGGNVMVTQVVSAAAGAGEWGVSYTGLDGLAAAAEADPAQTDTVLVAVLDSGIYADHELFADRTISSDSYNYLDGSEDLTDDYGHGTHVAGILAASTSSQVQFLVYKVLDEYGKGDSFTLLTAAYHAAQNGADVINISAAFQWDSTAFESEEASEEAFQKYETVMKAAAGKAVICVAAGNESTSLSNDLADIRYYPAVSDYAVTVSAIDEDEEILSTSCWGDAVDFTAPGDTIVSARPGGVSNYVPMTGTSMAAPFVSASAAMISLYQPDASPEEVIEGLRLYAKDLGETGTDKYYGNGCVVFPDPESIVMNCSCRDVYLRSRGADAFALPAESEQTIRYASSDTSVALVSQEGLVRVRKAGNAVIRIATDAVWDYTTGDLNIYSPAERSVLIKVRPKATEIKWIIAGSRKFTVGFLKRSSADGYQIKYSLRKDMSDETAVKVSGGDNHKKTVSGLKSGRTYYVRMRAFNYNQGQTWFGAWTEIVKVKVQ